MEGKAELEGRQIGVRLTGTLPEDVEVYRKKLQKHVPEGITITTSDAIRALLWLGLEKVESKKKSSR